ncbi:conserved hypothetical protein [Verrucomicrobia bacterium]|nr:conserved hypothetical protein [Verrucomicrobiota bacterium]
MSVTEFQDSASGLPDKERAELAAWLLDSLPPSSDEDAGEESLQEAERRREELDSGRLRPIAEGDFWTSVEGERKQWS